MEVRHVRAHVEGDDKPPHEARQPHRVPEVHPRETC